MIRLWREWAPRKEKFKRGKLGLLEDTVIENIVKTQYNPGYAGVYAFDEEVALKVKETQSIKGLNQHVAYANRLIIDIDSAPNLPAEPEAALLEGRLKDLGIGYEKWFSGSKGYHFVMEHELVGHRDLPYSHQQYVENNLKVACDNSLYQHGRLLSLPGRVHEKTFKKKALLCKVPGKQIEFELKEKPRIEREDKNINQ
jgi:hypothetical protein